VHFTNSHHNHKPASSSNTTQPATLTPTPQEMLDPTVGEGVVQSMQREVHRMELRLGELMRLQEKLMQVGLGSGVAVSGCLEGPLCSSKRTGCAA